ncbi:tyrosine recombinase XerC [Kitasatospora sp. NPDC101183]|uniref:site-specific integrase n=1 Tax=Kitasatospora sp. NPDC101183 TaxID=3364100 RepID=UPI00381D3899
MANNSGRQRRWGSVRKLPSGRFQGRYPGPDGALRNADETFETKGDAEAWLVETEADIRRGEWRDPNAGAVNFLLYATAWIDERDLVPLTEELYHRLLRLHIAPTFGESDVKDITAPQARSWRAGLRSRSIKTTAAKSCRPLKSIMETAVDDELIRRNPCRVKGGGKEVAAELMGPRWQLMVFIAAFMALRPEEQAELRCRDVDLEKGIVWIRRAAPELCTGERAVGDPKSEAGKRALRIPSELLPEFERHLRWYAQDGGNGLLFVGERGAPFRCSTFGRKWRKARKKPELEHLRFYDLRHTGNVLAASTGASLRDLMTFMGHNSPRAALIYQHATEEQQTKISNGISAAVVDIRSARRKRAASDTTAQAREA